MAFTGVKQPEFDRLVARHTAAASQLKDLAQKLHGELSAAGLDTTPAVRIEALAKRASAQAEDLRRRQKLIQEMVKQKIIFDDCRTSGAVFAVPDSIKAAEGLLDGTLAADAALAAAGGDAKALKKLQAYVSKAGDPDFAKVFMKKLGAKGATELPGTLAKQLRDALNKDDKTLGGELSTQAKQAMKLLSTAMAKATDPDDPAFLGEAYLAELVKQGRALHKGDGLDYYGYETQALIWRANDGKPPFSKRFMEVVGRDAIVFEKELFAGRWQADKDSLGRLFKDDQVPLLDRAGALNFGAVMNPSTQMASEKPVKPTVVGDLFHAASFNPAGARALFDHTPPGWKQPIFSYLLTERLDAFNGSGDVAGFRRSLIAATTGQDATSKKLAAEMTKILGDKTSAAFETGDDGNIKIKEKGALARYDFLRYPLARALAANMDEIFDVVLNHARFGKVGERNLDYALVLANSDDQGFDTLVRAQIEHTRKAFSGVPPVGLTASDLEKYGYRKSDFVMLDRNGSGTIDMHDATGWLHTRATEESTVFRHLLETRKHALISAGVEAKEAEEEANANLKAMVGMAFGMLPVPGAKQAGTLAPGVFGEMISTGYNALGSAGYDQIANHVTTALSGKGKTLDEEWTKVGTNAKAVERLMEQMIAATLLNNGSFDHAAHQLKGRTFATGVPPKIVRFDQMTPAQFADFMRWARRNSGVSDVIEWAGQVIDRSNEVRDTLNMPDELEENA